MTNSMTYNDACNSSQALGNFHPKKVMEQLKRSLCNLVIVDIMLEPGHRQCFKTVELQSYEQSSSLKFFIFYKIRETNAQKLEEALPISFPQLVIIWSQ